MPLLDKNSKNWILLRRVCKTGDPQQAPKSAKKLLVKMNKLLPMLSNFPKIFLVKVGYFFLSLFW